MHKSRPNNEKKQQRSANLFRYLTFTDTVRIRTINEQPIMRIEDRLFDRGRVRSALATRKCGNSYFPKYFMVVRPFLTKIFSQELFGLEGSKNLLEKIRQMHNLKISDRLLRPKSFFQKNIPGFICSVCVPFLGS